MKKQKQKKIIALSLCLGILFSSVSPFSTGLAAEVINKLKSGSTLDSSIHRELQINPPTENVFTTQVASGELQAITPTAETVKSQKSEKYTFSNEDVQTLLNQGYSVQDILKSDDLGNQLDVDPKTILEDHKKNPRGWEQVENEMKSVKFGPLIEQLKKRHPEDAKKLQGKSFTAEEQVSLLSMVDQHLVQSMDDIIKNYKESGEEAIYRATKENKFYGRVSKERMNKYHLTDEDVQSLRLTDEKLEEIEKLNKSGKASTNEYLEGRKQLKNAKTVGGNDSK
ncbi:hypothetical protein [Paenibacillus alba]|uniref:Uncharacterized protein n=1 Tax=Paenibacillus alba TaxID=1197127 RepID=A0ABU6GG05_9BACL|nr:hypothetical protein [Paenibacillus alba]MEC0232630.1 hypothetical protein [Paenibacillus alba]